jgi:hypothetical protein
MRLVAVRLKPGAVPGEVSNLASRLMGLARRSGVVLDGAFGVDLLPAEVASKFALDNRVYLPGIAEADPIAVYYTTEYTRRYRRAPNAHSRNTTGTCLRNTSL